MRKIMLGCLAVFLCALGSAADVKVVSAEGDESSGALQEINAEGIKVAGKTVPFSELVQLKFAATRSDPANNAPTISLRNGSVMVGVSIVSGSDTNLKAKTPAFGDVNLEIKLIDGIVFYAGSKKMPPGLEAFIKQAPPKEDLLLSIKGDTVSGFFEKFSDKDVSFNSNGQSRAFPFDQLAAVRLAALEKVDATASASAQVLASNGSKASGKLKGMEGSAILLEVTGGQTWKINTTEIASIEFSGGRMVYLSALEPVEVDQKPLVGGSPVVFSWRKDRSVAGTPMKIGESAYDKGIGVHSFCKLVYELNGAYAKFMTEAGMDNSAPVGAICSWQVRVDGKEAGAGTGKPNEKSSVKVDVTNAKRLELICDYGPDNDDAGDRFDFAKARLIKP